jgi:hypothetical protein
VLAAVLAISVGLEGRITVAPTADDSTVVPTAAQLSKKPTVAQRISEGEGAGVGGCCDLFLLLRILLHSYKEEQVRSLKHVLRRMCFEECSSAVQKWTDPVCE